jgi:hypothetical protein
MENPFNRGAGEMAADTLLPFVEEIAEKVGRSAGGIIGSFEVLRQALADVSPETVEKAMKATGGFAQLPDRWFARPYMNTFANNVLDRFFTGLGKGLPEGDRAKRGAIRRAANAAVEAELKDARGHIYVVYGRQKTLGPYSFYHRVDESGRCACRVVQDDQVAFQGEVRNTQVNEATKAAKAAGRGGTAPDLPDPPAYPGRAIRYTEMTAGMSPCPVCHPELAISRFAGQAEDGAKSFAGLMGKLEPAEQRRVRDLLDHVALYGTATQMAVLSTAMASEAMDQDTLKQLASPGTTLEAKLLLCRSVGGTPTLYAQAIDLAREAKDDVVDGVHDAADWAGRQAKMVWKGWLSGVLRSSMRLAEVFVVYWFVATIACVLMLFWSIKVNAGENTGSWLYGPGSVQISAMLLTFHLLMLDTLESVLINIPLMVANGVMKVGETLLGGFHGLTFNLFRAGDKVREQDGQWYQSGSFFLVRDKRRVRFFKDWRFTPALVATGLGFLAGWGFRTPDTEMVTFMIGSAVLVGVFCVAVFKVTRPVDDLGKVVPNGKPDRLGQNFRKASLAILVPTVVIMLLYVVFGRTLSHEMKRVEDTTQSAVSVSIDAAGKGVEGVDKAVNGTTAPAGSATAATTPAGQAAPAPAGGGSVSTRGAILWALILFALGFGLWRSKVSWLKPIGGAMMALAIVPVWLAFYDWYDGRDSQPKSRPAVTRTVSAPPTSTAPVRRGTEEQRQELCRINPDLPGC